VVLVLLAGRPYDLSRVVDRLAAVVSGFFAGEEGGPALAGVLTGAVDPSGRLPVGFPGAGSSQPSTYLSAPLAARSEVSVVDPSALFPFGHGLSYTPVRWEEATASSATWPTDGSLEVAVRVTNPHDRPASEVVQVYLHRPVADVALPVQRLVAFARVDLAAGESRSVTFGLHADLTSFTGRGGARIVPAGSVELRVAASSTDIRTTLPVTLAGATRVVGPDRVLEPTVRG
jgi:beta-glucosidase